MRRFLNWILYKLARKYWSEERDNEGQILFYTGDYPNGVDIPDVDDSADQFGTADLEPYPPEH